MPNRSRVSQAIDALDVRPLDDDLRQSAARNVRAAMSRHGHSPEQISEVLGALGLIDVIPPRLPDADDVPIANTA